MIAERVAKFVVSTVGGLIIVAALATGFTYLQLHEFSASDFEHATGHPLPASARILKGEAGDWDLHGDHDACALIEVSRQDYELLLSAIRPRMRSGDTTPCSAEMYTAFARYTAKAVESAAVEGGSFRSWALAAEEPVVMVQYSSW